MVEEGERGSDAFVVVKEFLRDLGDRSPQPAEVRRIAPALQEIYGRLMRVRSYAPKVDLSDRLWELMEMAGIHGRRVIGDEWFRKAAAL